MAVSPASAFVAVPASAVATVQVTVLAGAVPEASPPVMVSGDAVVKAAGDTGPSLRADEPAVVPCAHWTVTVNVPSVHRLPVPDAAPCVPVEHVPAASVNVLADPRALVLVNVTVVEALPPGTKARLGWPPFPYLLIDVQVYAPLVPDVDAHVVDTPDEFGPVSDNTGACPVPALLPWLVTLAVKPESEPVTLNAEDDNGGDAADPNEWGKPTTLRVASTALHGIGHDGAATCS